MGPSALDPHARESGRGVLDSVGRRVCLEDLDQEGELVSKAADLGQVHTDRARKLVRHAAKTTDKIDAIGCQADQDTAFVIGITAPMNDSHCLETLEQRGYRSTVEVKSPTEFTDGDGHVRGLAQHEQCEVLRVGQAFGTQQRSIGPHHGPTRRIKGETQLLIEPLGIGKGLHLILHPLSPHPRGRV